MTSAGATFKQLKEGYRESIKRIFLEEFGVPIRISHEAYRGELVAEREDGLIMTVEQTAFIVYFEQGYMAAEAVISKILAE